MGGRVELHQVRQDLSWACSPWTARNALPEQPAWRCSAHDGAAAHTMEQPTSRWPDDHTLQQQQPLHRPCSSSSHWARTAAAPALHPSAAAAAAWAPPPTTLAAMTSSSCAPLDTLLSTWQWRRVGSETDDEATPGGMVASI